jgi:hypothetical protein
MPSPRPAARTFRDLTVWQKAHEFVLAIYRLTESFPEREKYGLAHQMRRAAVSIPANIAEGFGKRSQAEKSRFFKHRGRLSRRVPLLADPGSRLGLWRSRIIDERAGTSQPLT